MPPRGDYEINTKNGMMPPAQKFAGGASIPGRRAGCGLAEADENLRVIPGSWRRPLDFRLPAIFLQTNNLIAFAGGSFQLGFAQNGYISPSVGDHSRSLQNARGYADRGTPRSEHLRQKFLRQGKSLTTNSIMTHQQPPRQSLFNVMKAVASGQLGGLNTQYHRITLQLPLERGAMRQQIAQDPDIHPVSRAIALSNDSQGAGLKTKNHR